MDFLQTKDEQCVNILLYLFKFLYISPKTAVREA